MGSNGSYCWDLLQWVRFPSKLLGEISLRGIRVSMVPNFVCSAGEGVDFFSVGGHQWRNTWGGGGFISNYRLPSCESAPSHLNSWANAGFSGVSLSLPDLPGGWGLCLSDWLRQIPSPGGPSGLEIWFSPVLGLFTSSFSSSINFTVFSWGFKWLNNVIMAVFNRKWFCLVWSVFFFPFSFHFFFQGHFISYALELALLLEKRYSFGNHRCKLF